MTVLSLTKTLRAVKHLYNHSLRITRLGRSAQVPALIRRIINEDSENKGRSVTALSVSVTTSPVELSGVTDR